MAKPKYAMLVYQCGIANVFSVKSLNLQDYGRDAVRLWQGAFHSCEMFARGLGAAGVIVRTASCNVAGDCAKVQWTDGLGATPFRDKAIEIKLNGLAK